MTLDRTLRELTRPLAAVACSLALIAALLLALGADPFTAARALIQGSLGSRFGIGETLVIATTLILTGLAATIPFSAGMWNIGGEGQLYAGAFGATAAAFLVPEAVGPWLHAGLAVLAGIAGGAAWGFIPGLLKSRWGANEVIVTLMLVFVAILLAEYAISSLWPSRASTTEPIPAGAALPVIWKGTSVHAGVLFAPAAIVLGWLLLRRSALGFAIRAVGENPQTARLNGIRVERVRVLAFTIGGAFAGAAGAGIVLGVSGALVSGFSANFGYIGIAVALMARLSPVWVVASALLFAILRVGSNGMQVATGLDPSAGDVIVAAFVITLLAFHVIRVKQLGSIRS